MKGLGKFMSRTPHMVTSKIGMAKSMSNLSPRGERGRMTVKYRIGGS